MSNGRAALDPSAPLFRYGSGTQLKSRGDLMLLAATLNNQLKGAGPRASRWGLSISNGEERPPAAAHRARGGR
jgi:hypothetical protein